MSLPTLGSPQLKITLSKLLKDGYLLGNVGDMESLSLAPELVGKPFGKMMATSAALGIKTTTRGATLKVACQCTNCGYMTHLKLRSLLLGADCRKCCMAKESPNWVVARAKGMYARCNNPLHKAYKHYGARGIEFKFQSPRHCADWISSNLITPLQDRNMQLDRIDNDGHYEPGNLRWASKHVNVCNTRRGGWMAKAHLFRIKHPDIRYADKTLRNLITLGFTEAEIVERYHRKSDKPKGVYGTFSTPDPAIAILAKDF